jgi:hypothetical protein
LTLSPLRMMPIQHRAFRMPPELPDFNAWAV